MPENRRRIDRFFAMFYQDLRSVASALVSREKAGYTLQPTALVNEAFLKLSAQRLTAFQNKSHFLAIGAMTMRRVLMDRARRSLSLKRKSVTLFHDQDESAWGSLTLEELMDLERALQELSHLDPRQSQMIDLRFFAGFTVQELAELFGLSARTVEYDLQMARAWLCHRIRR